MLSVIRRNRRKRSAETAVIIVLATAALLLTGSEGPWWPIPNFIGVGFLMVLALVVRRRMN